MSVSIDRSPPLRAVRLDTGPRNVLDLDAVRALRAALAFDAEAPVAVLEGRTDGFCAGLDNRVLAGDEREREALLTEMGELLLDALVSPTRIVAACRGHAVAAGAMLLLVADWRLGTPGDYKVGFTEPRLGMPLPELPALLARERVDRRRFHALTALGEIVGPEEARAVGFLDELVEPDALGPAARERAEALAALSESAYRGSSAAAHRDAVRRIEGLIAEQRARRDAVREAGPD